MEMNSERCNGEMCTSYPPITSKNICNDFNSTFFGKDFLTRVQPSLKCPIEAVGFFFNITIIFYLKFINILGNIHSQQLSR